MKTFHSKYKFYFIVCIIVYIIIELYMSRFHFLDDTFIHLRIAHNLMEKGYYSFNGLAPNFSTSSPLYTAILALCSFVSSSPFLPKIINLIIYGIILILLSFEFLKSKTQLYQFLLAILLISIASPFSIRWLTDGMETGLVVLFSIILGIMSRFLYTQVANTKIKILFILISALAIFLRVEFGYILFLSIVAILASTVPRISIKNAINKIIPLFIGGIIGTALVITIFGHLLPDTAVAKRIHSNISLSSSIGTLFVAGKMHLACSFFGISLLFLCLFSFIFAYKNNKDRPYTLIINLGFVLFLLLLILTQQRIQGIRYFLFIEIFLISSNLLTIRELKLPLPFILKPMASLILGIMILSWLSFDSYIVYKRIILGRSQTFSKFLNNNYDFLKNKTGVAWDIGMVGYFTNSNIIDINGLVNGRKLAKLNERQRLISLKNKNIDFFFANKNQIKELDNYITRNKYFCQEKFVFPNASGHNDTHFLFIKKSLLNNVKKRNY